ncbi:hypothetical protein IW262DRAFT_1390225 [Armillaria fumosa]|nr:hypothetical protein IW262DRAFT_1390225 [Armillaria fumosa]
MQSKGKEHCMSLCSRVLGLLPTSLLCALQSTAIPPAFFWISVYMAAMQQQRIHRAAITTLQSAFVLALINIERAPID